MKTLTEFSGVIVRKAHQVRSQGAADGKDEAALSESVGAAVGMKGDRLARLIEALQFVKQADNVRQIRVYQGEKGPAGCQTVGEYHYVLELLQSGSSKRRDQRSGRDGRRGDKRGRRSEARSDRPRSSPQRPTDAPSSPEAANNKRPRRGRADRIPNRDGSSSPPQRRSGTPEDPKNRPPKRSHSSDNRRTDKSNNRQGGRRDSRNRSEANRGPTSGEGWSVTRTPNQRGRRSQNANTPRGDKNSPRGRRQSPRGDSKGSPHGRGRSGRNAGGGRGSQTGARGGQQGRNKSQRQGRSPDPAIHPVYGNLSPSGPSTLGVPSGGQGSRKKRKGAKRDDAGNRLPKPKSDINGNVAGKQTGDVNGNLCTAEPDIDDDIGNRL